MNRIKQLIFLALFAGCASSKTELTIVDGFPQKQNAERQADIKRDFVKPALTLKLGEANPIRNLDPLFANNEASQRLLGWVYEGLTAYNQEGKLIPALASRWQVSPDSLRYTFTLRKDSYFHSDPLISSGAGRTVTATDVKKVFERMAVSGVPSLAASLFSNSIRGFDAFFTEQHAVFDAEERRLTEISGIVAENDSTVSFLLNVPDRNLLAKLAAPVALIYPIEAVSILDRGLKNHPVGSGPWKFVQSLGDSVWVFETNPKHPSMQRRPSDAVAKVEVTVNLNESALYKRFASGELHALLDITPGIAKTMLSETGTLLEAFQTDYEIQSREALETISFQINPSNYNRISKTDANSLLQPLNIDAFVPQINPQLFSIGTRFAMKEASTLAKLKTDYAPGNTAGKKVIVAFPNDQNSRFIGRYLGNELNKTISIQLVQSAIVSRDITIYAHRKSAFGFENTLFSTENELFSVKMRRVLAKRKGITGLEQNAFSWWLNITNATVPVAKELQP